MKPKQVIEYAKTNECEIVDLKFSDMLGLWQHFSIPASELEEERFDVGVGFDGSSIRGWQAIHASDMLVVPVPSKLSHMKDKRRYSLPCYEVIAHMPLNA